MKLLRKDLRQGIVTVMLQTADDAWYLGQIVASGDVVRGKTTRKMRAGGKDEGDATKRTLTLGVSVESTAFQGSTIRFSGRLVEAPEDLPQGAHHTITSGEGDTLTIVKEHWDAYQLGRLEEATREQTTVLIIAMDREQAIFARTTAQGYEILADLHGDVAKKYEGNAVGKNFYQSIIATLQEYVQRYNIPQIILASPAFWKDELLKEIQDEKLRGRIVTANCGSVSKNAIEEVLKRDELKSALRDAHAAREAVFVEKILTEIAKNGHVAYGIAEVEEAVIAGAADLLTVSTGLIANARNHGTFARIESLMKHTEQTRGKVSVVNSENDAGRQLDGIGGIAALLRYAMNTNHG